MFEFDETPTTLTETIGVIAMCLAIGSGGVLLAVGALYVTHFFIG